MAPFVYQKYQKTQYLQLQRSIFLAILLWATAATGLFAQTVTGDWYGLLRGAGLEVLDIIEPKPVESGSGQDWGDHYAPKRQRMVPATIIWKARKPFRARGARRRQEPDHERP